MGGVEEAEGAREGGMTSSAVPAAAPGRLPLRALLSLADQAAVSGTNFLATLLIARACGSPAELGLYTLAFTLVVLCVSAQDAVVITPFTVLGPQVPPDEQ